MLKKRTINVEKLRKYKVFVATPCYGGMTTGVYARSSNETVAAFTKMGIGIKFFYLFNESLIQRARNYCAAEFLRAKEYTHLLFIDSDIGFRYQDVLSLLDTYDSDPEKYDIVAGPYPKKTIAWEKVDAVAKSNRVGNPDDLTHFGADFVFNLAPGQSTFNINEPVEVMEAGTGFMLIARETFRKFSAYYPDATYRPDHVRTKGFDGSEEIGNFFDVTIDPKTRRQLSEDYHFCQYSRKAGMRVWMLPWIELIHVGSYPFMGSMPALASMGLPMTASPKGTVHVPKLPSAKPNPKKKLFRP